MNIPQYRILIVDDSFDTREAVRDMLKFGGYEVMEATNGAEGLLKAADFQPHLYLIDVVMPGMDGLEMLQRLDIKNSLSHAIVMTGRENLSDAKRAMELGAFSYIGKPLHFSELNGHVQRALADVQAACQRQEYQAQLEVMVAERTRELKEALMIVENQHQRLDAIINSIDEALLAVDRDERIMLTNRKFNTLFKTTLFEIASQPLDVITPDTAFITGVRAMLTRNGSQELLTLHIGEGKTLRFQTRASTVFNHQDMPIGTIITFNEQPVQS